MAEHSLKEENGFGYLLTGDYCVIEYYNGAETDVKIPEELGGKQNIYVDIFGIKGKNKQVRTIHLSKNVSGIYGNPKKEEDSYSDKVHSSLQMETYSDELRWKEILVDEENPFFTSKDGVLYSKDMKTLYVLPALIKGRLPKTIQTVSLYHQSFRKIMTENKMLKINDDVLYGGELDDNESVITNRAAKRYAKENKVKIVVCS